MSNWHLLIATALVGSMTAFAPLAAQTSTEEAQEQDAQSAETTEQQTQQSAGQQDASDQVDVIALPEWHAEYEELYAGVTVEEILDSEVEGPTGDDIGDVENLIISQDGEVLSVIAEVGGFAEIADTHVSIPWDEVEVEVAEDDISIPLTQETIEDYSLFTDPVLTAEEAGEVIQAVGGDDAGVVLTGPRAWRATELIGDYARLSDGDGFINYGYVDDLVIRDGQVAAVVVSPDVTWGAPGPYAYPYYGYWGGWHPGLAYYDLPYEREEVAMLEPLEEEEFDD